MDEEYPYYVRTKVRSDSLEFESCPGQNCGGEVTNDGGLLNWSGTTWECEECGVQYRMDETNKSEFAGLVNDSLDGVATTGFYYNPEKDAYFDMG